MRWMTIVKHKESQGFPPQELFDAIAELGKEATENGTMLDTGGLLPSAQGASVRIKDGEITVTDGPYSEAKEVIGGFAIFEFKTKEEAVEAAVHFMELHKKYWPGWEGETEVRPMMDAPPEASYEELKTAKKGKR
jgi:hypothetical protein